MPDARPEKTAIRRARPADAADLTRIAHAAKRYWGYPEKLIRLWKADLTVTPERITTQPVYCAVHAGKIAGFYALSGEGRHRELEHMWVDPPHIGRGVGKRLFTHLLRRLGAMRVSRLEIAADPNAEGFYCRMGARLVGSVPSTPAGRRLPLLAIRLSADGQLQRQPVPSDRQRTRGANRVRATRNPRSAG